MKLRHLTFLLVTALFACRAEPRVNGQSLACDPGACPTHMRCHEGVCIINTPPQLEPFEDLRVVPVGVTRVFTARASNQEADPLVFEWSQVAGPSEALVSDGPELRLTAQEPGLHTFRVSVDDGFMADAELPVADLRVMVVPAVAAHQSLLYVSDLATEVSGCGAHDAPCPTVAAAIREARGAPAMVIVGANRSTPAYRECLQIRDEVVVVGSFDPVTWIRESNPEPSTEFTCHRCAPGQTQCAGCAAEATRCGHTLGPDASVHDLVMSLDDQMAPGIGESELATVWLEGSSTASAAGPRLDGVDIRIPLCGPTCAGIGIISLGAEAALVGVNISGTAGPLAANADTVGLLALGGSLSIAPGPAGVEQRTTFFMTTPTLGEAIGVLARGAEVSINEVTILGRAAPRLTGIELRDSTATVDGSHLDLTVDGPGQNFGIYVRSCNSPGSTCSCISSLGDCAPSAQPGGTIKPTVLKDNIISMRGQLRFDIGACTASGIKLESEIPGTRIEGNSIDVQANVEVAIGVEVGGTGDSAAVDTDIIDNTVRVAHDHTGAACDRTIASSQVRPFPGGPMLAPAGVGISIHQGSQTRVEGNRVSVDSARDLAVGLVATAGAWHQIRDNDFAVGSDPAYQSSEAWSAVLGQSAGASGFVGNRATVGGSARRGIALRLISTTFWTVENNFLYGGDRSHCIGVDVAPPSILSDATGHNSWPRFLNNTVVAGGLVAPCHTSQAVAFDITANIPWDPLVTAGVFVNNLFDAGHATGRRYIFANESATWLAAGGNVSQMVGEAPKPTATYLRRIQAGGWAVLLENAGQLVLTRNVSPDGGVELSHVDLLKPPTAYTSATGLGGLLDSIAIGAEGVVTLIAANEEFAPVSTIPLRIGSEVSSTPLVPRQLAAGDINHDGAVDLVFWATADSMPASLWHVTANDGGFSPARTISAMLISRDGSGQVVARTPLNLSSPAPIRMAEASASTTVYLLDAGSVYFSHGLLTDDELTFEELDLGSVLTTAGLSSDAHVSDLSVLVGLGGRHEVVLVAEQQLVAVSRFFFDAPRPATVTVPCAAPDTSVQTIPCELAGGIAHVATAEIVASADRVVIACADGTIEPYLLAPNDTDPINEPAQLSCAGTTVSIDTGLGQDGISQISVAPGGTIAVLDAGGQSVAVLTCFLNICAETWRVGFLTEIAAHIHTDEAPSLVDRFPDNVGIINAAEICPLVAHSGPTMPPDLHLDGSGGDCAEGGVSQISLNLPDGEVESVVAPTSDIESDARNDPPDAGADERP